MWCYMSLKSAATALAEIALCGYNSLRGERVFVFVAANKNEKGYSNREPTRMRDTTGNIPKAIPREPVVPFRKPAPRKPD